MNDHYYDKQADDSFESLVRDMFRNATSGIGKEGDAAMKRDEHYHGINYYNRAADLLGEDRPGTPHESATDVLRDIRQHAGQIYIYLNSPLRDRIDRVLEREGKS